MNVKRYLLFDSGCTLCTSLAQQVEKVAKDWLEVKSLRDREVQALLNRVKPDWQWHPTLLEVQNEKVRVFTGAAMFIRFVFGLGPNRAWKVVRAIREVKASSIVPAEPARREFLRGAMLFGIATTVGLPNLVSRKNRASYAEGNDAVTYTDPDYGFSFRHPPAWRLNETIIQPQPLRREKAILKRLTSVLPIGAMDLDVWLSHGLPLDKWLEDYLITRPEPGLSSELNATVAGQPATTYIHSGHHTMVGTFFAYKDYVYRLWHLVNPGQLPDSAYRGILQSFILPDGTTGPTDVPLGSSQEFSRSAGPLLVDSCCGYTCSGNPFVCCSDGNCVWWVYRCFIDWGGVPFRGNAADWWTEVDNYWTWCKTTSGPIPNTRQILNWDAVAKPDWGHVAYAPTYNSGDSTIHVTEMGCEVPNWYCVRNNYINISEPRGYIYYCGW